MPDEKPFIGINVGNGPIKMPPTAYELRPTKIYLKEDGARNNGPSVAILYEHPLHLQAPVVGQLSIEMWNEGLKDIGYKLVKL